VDLPMRTTAPPGLVFAGVGGGYLAHNWWHRKVWMPACERAGLAGFHFHWLRHGFASLMAAWGLLGEFPLYVAQQMGHADATTTHRVYAKLLREGVRLDREETLRRLYAAFKGEQLAAATPVLPREGRRKAPMRKTPRQIWSRRGDSNPWPAHYEFKKPCPLGSPVVPGRAIFLGF